MKKRYWIPSALLVAVGGLLAWGYYGHEDLIRKANSGDMEACESLKGYAGEDTKVRITDASCSALLATVSADGDVATSTTAVTEDKTHSDFKSTGPMSDYERCLKTRAQINKEIPGKGDELFKCEELKSYLKPAERVKAAERQGLVQKCEQTIKAALNDPRSYRFVDRKYIATENNGLDIRVTYSATNAVGGRIQGQQTCNYKF